MFLLQIRILLPWDFEGGGWYWYSTNKATQAQLSLQVLTNWVRFTLDLVSGQCLPCAAGYAKENILAKFEKYVNFKCDLLPNQMT